MPIGGIPGQPEAGVAQALDALASAQLQVGASINQMAKPPGPGPQSLLGTSLKVSVPQDIGDFVAGQVSAGRYLDAGEVVRDALRRLMCDPCTAGAGPDASSPVAVADVLSGLAESIFGPAQALPAPEQGLFVLQRLAAAVQRDIDANAGRPGVPLDLGTGLGSERAYTALLAPVPDDETAAGWRLAPVPRTEAGVRDVTQLEAVRDELRRRLNGLEAVLQGRSQRTTERSAQALELLSNVAALLAEARAVLTEPGDRAALLALLQSVQDHASALDAVHGRLIALQHGAADAVATGATAHAGITAALEAVARDLGKPTGPGGGGAGGSAQSRLLDATRQLQETQMSFNLQYLQLQSQMQHENRSFTAISNIMKTKHDTIKNSISNIR